MIFFYYSRYIECFKIKIKIQVFNKMLDQSSEANYNKLAAKVRQKARDFFNKANYETALFWADKAASFSRNSPQDLFIKVQAMFHLKQYDRGAKTIEHIKYQNLYFAFRYELANCYFCMKKYQEALQVLGDNEESNVRFNIKLPSSKNVEGVPDDKEVQCSMYLLKGDCYKSLEINESAVECYTDALNIDVYCYEAFNRLVDNHLLSRDDEEALINRLMSKATSQSHSAEEIDMLKFMYSLRIKKYDKPDKFEVPEKFDVLTKNLDVATALAERHYYNGELKTSYNYAEAIMKRDPFHSHCLPLYISLLVLMKKPTKLYYLAHQIVELYPDLSIPWYAIGCYYLMQKGKQDLAQRFFEKATLVDSFYGPAFLSYGHSFAKGKC